MKLYEVPRETKVRVLEDGDGPMGSLAVKKGDIVFFNHVDGMYSSCRLDSGEGPVRHVHLKAWTEVEIVK